MKFLSHFFLPNTRVYCMHGVVKDKNDLLFVHRNMNDWTAFESFLRSRTNPFVSLKEMQQGKGDALTIDDATYAAFDAARISRELGHQVTFFVNPYHIVCEATYMPALLNIFFDGINEATEKILFQDVTFFVRSTQERSVARKKMKNILFHLSAAEAEIEIRQCARLNGVTLHVPRHLKSLTADELHELSKLGVTIANHGWEHRSHIRLSEKAKRENITMGCEWVQSTFGVCAPVFAVPYGVDETASIPENEQWYLLDETKKSGVCGERRINRITFT